MVGSSPIRSSSPMLTRPSHNPNSIQNPNNPERKGTGVRKSFNGYPLVKSSLVYQQKGLVPNTPVNSPAEYARGLDGRNSGVVSFRDHEQKENQNDLNVIKPTARAKSPSVNTKGTKHFMSPTISAASKINPSPRKKVLGDRNEAIRTSASLSDGKFHFFSTSSLESDDEQDESKSAMPTSFDKASEPDKHEFQHQNGFDSSCGEVKTEAFEADLVVLSPDVPLNTVKSTGSLPLSEMPTLVIDEAPLDADQSLPPYDPKRNYLSPRPQFLHYNPNWRTENYVNQGMNLEDDFTSESVSEIENSSEEIQSEDSLKDQEDASSVTSSNSSVEVSLGDLAPLSDMNTTESPHPVEMVEAELEPRRSRWFTNWKFVAVLLLISLGFMSILLTSHPGIGNVVYRDEIISRVYNNPHAAALAEHFSELAKNAKFWTASCVDYMQNEILSRVYNNPHTAALVEHFSGFAENAKFWAASCVDYMSQILQNVGEVDRFSSVTFSNLTAWQEEEDWGYFVKEFETEPYFGSVEESQGYRELPNVQTVLQNYEIKDEASVQMQSYPAPEDNNDSSAEVADIVKLDDSQPEVVKQDHEIEDEASAQMQSYSTSEDNGSLNGETALAKVVESEDVKQNHEIKDEASEEMQSYSALADNENSAGEAELVKTIDSELINEENVVMEDSDTVNAEQALSEDEPASMVDEVNVGEQQTDVKEVSQVSEIQREVISTNEPSENGDMNNDDDVQPTEKDATKSVGNSQFWKPSEKSLTPMAMAAAITLVIVSLLAAFMYMKPKKESTLVDQSIAEKEPSVDQNIAEDDETPSSYSGPVEVDMVGESCPSEMSSFHNSVYTKSKQMDGDEAHSLQKSSKRNVKRESLASSSSEFSKDPSYGSFSTYSIIHPKKGDGEVVTPVRRSSRIRSKVTSP
ncbi:uncharacterized protein LOC141611412 [Silene latifolia]|uniref:uncharacterized protein LOC141611412 n=1 Tax=Silene latifolia TaxID=37657 RepID=UPI003D7795CF